MPTSVTGDLDDLSKAFATAAKNAPQMMDGWLHDVGAQIESQMRLSAAVRSGRLNNSIRMTSAAGRVEIGTTDQSLPLPRTRGPVVTGGSVNVMKVVDAALPRAAQLGADAVVKASS